jgi:hypothetical protein
MEDREMKIIAQSAAVALIGVLAMAVTVCGQATLEAYYTFDNTVTDATANHGDATLAGDAGYSSATPPAISHSTHSLQVGTGTVVGGWAELPASVTTDPLDAGAFSISVWGRITDIDFNNNALFHKLTPGQDWGDTDWKILQVHDNYEYWFLCPSPFISTPVVSPITNDTWHHFAMTYNGTGTWSFYLDNSAGIGQTLTPGTGDNLVIGSDSRGEHPFIGQIDDVAIYSGVLTPPEVQDLFNGVPPLGAAATPGTLIYSK